MRDLTESSGYAIFADKTALKQAAVEGLGISDPTDSDYYDLMSRVIAGCTSSMRMSTSIPASEGTQRLTMQSILTSMTPYPRIHYAVPSVAPLRKEAKSVNADDPDATGDVAWQGITSGKLSSMDPSAGKNIAMALLCRGILHGTAHERFAEWKTKRSCVYVDWAPTGLVLGAHRDPVVAGGCEAIGLHNHTGVATLFKSWANSFDEEDKKAFLAYGMEESELNEAREDMASLLKDYEEVAAETGEDSGGEEEE